MNEREIKRELITSFRLRILNLYQITFSFLIAFAYLIYAGDHILTKSRLTNNTLILLILFFLLIISTSSILSFSNRILGAVLNKKYDLLNTDRMADEITFFVGPIIFYFLFCNF